MKTYTNYSKIKLLNSFTYKDPIYSICEFINLARNLAYD